MSDRALLFAIGYLLSAAMLLATGGIVLIANHKARVNQWFFALMVSCALWLGAVFMSDMFLVRTTLIYDELALLLGNFIAISFFYFTKEVIYSSKFNKVIYMLFYSAFSLSVLFTLFGFSIAGKDPNYNGTSSNIFIGFGYYFHIIYIFTTLLTCIYVLYRKAKNKRTKGALNQFYLIAVGGLFGTLINLVNEIYYIVFRAENGFVGYSYDYFSALSLVIFAGFSAYAVIKHGIFDFRRAAARAFTYFLFILTVCMMFGAVISLLITKFINAVIGPLELLLSTIVIIFAALTLPYILRFFNRLTDRLFYRKAYDLKTSIGDLTSILVSQVAIKDTIEQSANYLQETIEPQHAVIAAVDDDRVVTLMTIGSQPKSQEVGKLIKTNLPLIVSQPENIILREHVKQTDKLFNFFTKTDSRLILRLVTNEGFVGLILLGPKLSGGFYTKQDETLLEITSKNLSLAIQNALKYEKIKKFADTMQHEVNVATKELQRSNAELQRLSKAKDEFISMASHQLQPQLSASRGFIELIGRDKKTDTELIPLIQSSNARMTQLVSDMLNVTKIQAGEFILETEAVDLVKLIDNEITNLKFAIAKHKVHMEFQHPKKAMVEVDSQKFREALFNLLDNAIQYSYPGGTVYVSISIEGKTTKVKISDRGIGIPEKDQARLFTNYFRATNAVEKRPNGTGIGLFVSKKILEAHGCELTIISEPGYGTQVLVNIRKPTMAATGAKKAVTNG